VGVSQALGDTEGARASLAAAAAIPFIGPLAKVLRAVDRMGEGGEGARTRVEAAQQLGRTGEAKAGAGTRGSHFTDANKSLAAAMNKDPAFAKMMDDLDIRIPDRLDQSPGGWSWHHVPNQPGTLQLVPRAQHQGAPWQPLLHPNQTGGFKLWGADY
jgi:hypothetical protein